MTSPTPTQAPTATLAPPAATAAPSQTGTSGLSVFLCMLSGQIESAEFPDADDLYFKYGFVMGPDWDLIVGLEEGVSQVSKKSRDERQIHSINFPIEATFKSTNPFGWPQITIQAYGFNWLGNTVIQGYGATHIPPTPGRHVVRIGLFAPQSSSVMQNVASFFTSTYPEFVDPRVVARAEGREMARVATQGYVTLVLNVVTKDLKRLGYQTAPSASSIGILGTAASASASQ